jgi:hypothetical protein
MASILDLPQELINFIISDLSKRDCKNLRLTSSSLSASSIPGVARDVHLALHPQSWRSLQTLAADTRFSQHVESLTLFANLLPEISSYAGWRDTLDTKPFRRQAGQPGSYRPISEILYCKYGEYREARKAQQAMISSFQWQIKLWELLESFPKLHKFIVPMWYDCWRTEPTAEHYGGRICASDEFWHLLRPVKLPSSPGSMNFCFERWSVNWDRNPDVFRSSIIQTRLIGASILLPLQNRLPDNSIRIDAMDLAFSFDAQDQAGAEFVDAELVSGDGLDDSARYEQIVGACADSLTETRASYLKELSLHIQDSTDYNPSARLMTAIGTFLNTATSLTGLRIRFDPSAFQGGYDALLSLRDCTIPELKSLHLSSSYVIFTSKESLERLAQNHAKTLRNLSLNRIALNFEDDDTWSDLLQMLRKVLSLATFSISNVLNQRGTHEESWYFTSQEAAGCVAMCNYVLRQGPWPQPELNCFQGTSLEGNAEFSATRHQRAP